jgi:cell fate regulator YaaT (PSP1 superfamily)
MRQAFATKFKHAPVAQLDRALDYGSRGCGFDLCRARQITRLEPVSIKADRL